MSYAKVDCSHLNPDAKRLSTACLGQVIIKIMQLKILLRVKWTRLVDRGLNNAILLIIKN